MSDITPRQAKHITITMPLPLKKALQDYIKNLSLPAGAKANISSYVCVAITEKLTKDGALPTE